jgi:hypothetical protein
MTKGVQQKLFVTEKKKFFFTFYIELQYMNVHKYAYTHMYVYVCMYGPMYLCIQIHFIKDTQTHTHLNIYIYI